MFTTIRSFASLRVSLARLAPKKKPGKSTDAAVAEKHAPGLDHIYNIFAGLEDVKVQPDDKYPAWLWELEKPQKTYGEVEATFVYGKDIENATLYDYRRFLRHHRKLRIKLNNKRLERRGSPVESKLIN